MSQTKSKCSTKIKTFHSLKSISGGCVCDRTAKPLVPRSSTANVHSKRDCVRCLHWRGKNFLSTRWKIKYCSLFLENIAWPTIDYNKNVLLPRERQLETYHLRPFCMMIVYKIKSLSFNRKKQFKIIQDKNIFPGEDKLYHLTRAATLYDDF